MAMKLRPARLTDFEELVVMFTDLIATVYDGFKMNEPIFFYGTVSLWYHGNRDIIVCEKDDGTITGFSVSYVEDPSYIEPYYMGDIAYVKPEFRKGRTAYMLYNNVVDYAAQQGLPVIAKAFVSEENIDQVNKIQARWGKPRFVEYHKGVTSG